MSKKKRTMKTGKIGLILLAVIVLAAGIALTAYTVQNRHIRDTIDARYGAVQFPGWLYLSEKKYYGDHSYWDGPAAKNVKENWTYTYLPVAKEVQLEDMCDIIAKSLKAAGYSTTESGREMSGAYATLHATGKNLTLDVDISTYPAFGGSPRTSTVQSVAVQAHE